MRDFRYAFRLLRKNPGATVVAVLALALGIGGTIGTFTFVEALVLNPLPYSDPQRIMTLWETVPKLASERSSVAPGNFLDWREQSGAFEELAAYRPWSVNVITGRDPEPVRASLVSPAFFALLGIRAETGRTFVSGEDEPSRDGVVVLSHGFWRERLGGDENVLNRTISLAGRSYQVIGVMPNDFDFPLGNEVWVPLSLAARERIDRTSRNLMILGRLKENLSVREANAEMAAIAGRLERDYPASNEGRSVIVMPLRELINDRTDRFVTILFGASVFVLLLAAANVANLQLARSTARQKATAIQAALGANRFQLARPLLAESILLATLGGALGLLFASWQVDLSRSTVPPQVYQWVAGIRTAHIDSKALMFALAAALVTGVLCSLPAMFQLLHRSSAAILNVTLNEGGRTSADGRGRSRLRSALVVSEVAMALVLLIGAGLMVNTFQRMLNSDLGYNPRNVLAMQVSLRATEYVEPSRIAAFYDDVLSALATIPGVKSAGAASAIGRTDGMFFDGRPEAQPGDPRPILRTVSDHYFEAMEIPILRGRGISSQDGAESSSVVVVSESVANYYWPNSDPVGQRVRLGDARSPWRTVVGVSGDVKDWFIDQSVPAAYIPYRQSPPLSMRLLLRTEGDPLLWAGAARARIREVGPNEPLYDVKTMEQILSEQRSGVAASARSMTIFAVTALLLALTGIYALMSYAVIQRVREIGVRVALGATTADVLRMTLGQASRIAGLGLAIGVPVSYALMRVMSSILYNVVLIDWTTLFLFTALLGFSALLAAYVPARRASRVDPITALRHE